MIKRKINYKSALAYYEIGEGLKDFVRDDTVIICIGTDKCIGDCLGPLVGTLLESSLFPCLWLQVLDLNQRLDEINKKHPNACIIGIDACLGDLDSIGEIHTRDYAIRPGKGVGKSLPEVGMASIIGIVDSSNSSDLFSSRSIRLSLILDMAKVISKGLLYAYSLNKNLDFAL